MLFQPSEQSKKSLVREHLGEISVGFHEGIFLHVAQGESFSIGNLSCIPHSKKTARQAGPMPERTQITGDYIRKSKMSPRRSWAEKNWTNSARAEYLVTLYVG